MFLDHDGWEKIRDVWLKWEFWRRRIGEGKTYVPAIAAGDLNVAHRNAREDLGRSS